MSDRTERDFKEAAQYWDQIFREAGKLMQANREADDSTIAYDTVRVLGHDEINSLVEELIDYSESGWKRIMKMSESGRMWDVDDIAKMMTPQMLLAFMAGYRHAIMEVELPTLDDLEVTPDGP